MKNVKHLLLVLVVLMLGVQGAEAADFPVGKSLSDLGNSTKFFIYNVGTKQYINAGGFWGTQAVLEEYGNIYTYGTQRLQGSSTTYSYFGSKKDSKEGDTNFLGCATDKWSISKKISFTNSSNYSLHYFNVSSVGTEGLDVAEGSYVYTIQFANFGDKYTDYTSHYLIAQDDETVGISTSISGSNAYWMFVSYDDAKKHFYDTKAAEATMAAPANGTFLLENPSFANLDQGISSWKYGSTMSYSLENGNVNVLPASQTADYYVGVGYTQTGPSSSSVITTDGSKTDDNARWADDNYTDDDHSNDAQCYFGGLWTANIHCANGQIAQSITVEKSGWYQIQCDGFTTVEGSASLFAYAQNGKGTDESGADASAQNVLVTVGTAPTTYAKAGQLLKTNTNGAYTQYVTIYVNEGETIVFGVKTEESNTWTCVDNFQIKYCGNQKKYLVLDELQTEMEYINKQVDNEKSYPMVLARSLKAGQWNSLILPVNLTAQQVKSAFGGATKLSTIVGMNAETNWYRLNFKSVDLSDDAGEGIKAGTLYIIKPAVAPTKEASEDAPAKFSIRGYEEEKTIEIMQNYYLVNQVSLTEEPDQENGIKKQEKVPGNAELTGDLTFKGSYIYKTEKTIPAHSFLLSANTGAWYLTKTESYPVKGFRTWIETSKNGNNAKVAFYNDGVEMGGGELTGISDVLSDMGFNVSGKVYNVSGQLVREGATLEGLSKGVYIVNGKKYIVK